MADHYTVCRRWVDVVTGKKDRLLKGSRIFSDRDTIYSYGHHFPLAVALRDKKDQVALFLLNGDRYSVSTTQHQSHIRSAVASSDVPNVIIPFSALAAAGIDSSSIELIAHEPARHESIRHTARVQPEGSVWLVEPISGYVRKTDEEIADLLVRRNKIRAEYGDDRVITAADLQQYETHTYQQTGTETRLHSSSHRGHLIDVTEDEQGLLYTWTSFRHWLGESVIRAKVGSARRVNCKVCKGSGRAAEGWSDPNVGGGLSFHCAPCGGRGGRTVWSNRTAFFLSGFDRNEPRASYFFCELPKGVDVTSVDEALEALKPETVKVAEAHGREVKRQGDIFAIPLSASVDKKSLRKQGATFARTAELLGTNHNATEVALLDGRTLARGSLRHAPARRRPDHRRVILGDGWHLIVKNTVPVTKK